jgi:hypothetical protein
MRSCGDGRLRPSSRDVARTVFGEIEQRWWERFCENEIERLRQSLWAIARQLEMAAERRWRASPREAARLRRISPAAAGDRETVG